MSEFWLCFNCCIAEQPQPKRRRRIDRSMIGEPTNFVHTAHVGSGDLFSGMNSVTPSRTRCSPRGATGVGCLPACRCSLWTQRLDSPSSRHCEFLCFLFSLLIFCCCDSFSNTKKKCDGILFTLL
uniref:CDC42 small effector protein 2 n=2 Tax=Canis lupus familiaris TaxID=9615 RepID=A0A8P0N3Y1_CANLF